MKFTVVCETISEAARVVRGLQNESDSECCKPHSPPATKQDLREMEHRIMSAISNFADAQAAFNARLDGAIVGLQTALAGLTGDIARLNALITELQGSVGQITPSDQLLLDNLQSQAEALTVRAEAVSAALASLDLLTP
jgi:hypothetical protein